MSAADLILLVGDITNNGQTENISVIIEFIRQYNQSILAIPGNWDGQPVSKYLESEKISLDRRHVLLGQTAFVGVGGSLIANDTPNEISEAEFEFFLNQAVDGLDLGLPLILVSHQPPFATLTDKTWLNDHIGSKSVRSFIERTQPLLCFTGHVHEGIGIDTIGITKIINPGPVWKNQYAYAEVMEGKVLCLEIRDF